MEESLPVKVGFVGRGLGVVGFVGRRGRWRGFCRCVGSVCVHVLRDSQCRLTNDDERILSCQGGFCGDKGKVW